MAGAGSETLARLLGRWWGTGPVGQVHRAQRVDRSSIIKSLIWGGSWPETASPPSTPQAPRPASWASSYLLEEAEGLLGGCGGQDGVAATGAGPQGEGEAGHHLGLQLCDADLVLCHCQQCLPKHGLRQGGNHLRQGGAGMGESQERRTPHPSPNSQPGRNLSAAGREAQGVGQIGRQDSWALP